MAKKRAKKAPASCSTKSACKCGCGGKVLLCIVGALISGLGLLLVVAGVLAQVKASCSLWWVFAKYAAGLLLLMLGAKCKCHGMCH